MKNVLPSLLVSYCVLALSMTFANAAKAPSSSSSSSSSAAAASSNQSMSKEMRAMLTSHDGYTYSKIIIDRKFVDPELKKYGKSLFGTMAMRIYRGLADEWMENIKENTDTEVPLNKFKEHLIIELKVMVSENGGLLSKQKTKFHLIKSVDELPTKETNGKPLRIVLNYDHKDDHLYAT